MVRSNRSNLKAMDYWVSPSGNNGNAGTLASPWKSLNYSWNMLYAGDRLYMRGGTYTESYSSLIGIRVSNRSGTSGNLIRVENYQDEEVIYDGSGLSGSGEMFGVLMVSCDYWYIKGLQIQNVRGVNFSRGHEFQDGCSNVTLERVDITLCGCGFTFGGSIPFYNIVYLNCNVWDNWDTIDNGGYCNGFNGNLPVGSTVICIGCRAWFNSDDGYDNMAGGGYITYINCWAFWNGHASIEGSTRGDGDGFKLGYSNKGDEPGNQRILYNCLAVENDLMGFDESMDAVTSQDMALYNCVAYANGDYGFRFSAANIGGAGTGVTTLRNNIALNNITNYEGRARNISDHNTWDGGVTVTPDDFDSLDSEGPPGLNAPRQSDGSLPILGFGYLAAGSDLINAGDDTDIYTTDGVGYTWDAPPSMGAYEYDGVPPVPPVDIPVTNIEVIGEGNKTVITIDDGTLQMSATVLPVNATDSSVTWSVIAGTGTGSISVTGLLTALTNGTVTVRATANDGSAVYGERVITISNQVIIPPPPAFDGTFIDGWHLPSWAEWSELISLIYGAPEVEWIFEVAWNAVHNKLKEVGMNYWLHSNGIDLYGFRGLGIGYRLYDGTFEDGGRRNFYHSSEPYTSGYLGLALYDAPNWNYAVWSFSGPEDKKMGMSIRLIKDTSDWNMGETITDYDGHVYPTVKIGTQVWMAQDLRAVHYRDGTPIPEVTGNAAWAALTTAGMCYYNNTP